MENRIVDKWYALKGPYNTIVYCVWILIVSFWGFWSLFLCYGSSCSFGFLGLLLTFLFVAAR